MQVLVEPGGHSAEDVLLVGGFVEEVAFAGVDDELGRDVVVAEGVPVFVGLRDGDLGIAVAGDRDAEVPVTQSYEYWHALRDHNVSTQLVIYPGEGHLFYKPADQQDVFRRMTAWFDKYLH